MFFLCTALYTQSIRAATVWNCDVVEAHAMVLNQKGMLLSNHVARK